MKRQINSDVPKGFRGFNLNLDFLDKLTSSTPSNLASHPFNTQISIFHFNRKAVVSS